MALQICRGALQRCLNRSGGDDQRSILNATVLQDDVALVADQLEGLRPRSSQLGVVSPSRSTTARLTVMATKAEMGTATVMAIVSVTMTVM